MRYSNCTFSFPYFFSLLNTPDSINVFDHTTTFAHSLSINKMYEYTQINASYNGKLPIIPTYQKTELLFTFFCHLYLIINFLYKLKFVQRVDYIGQFYVINILYLYIKQCCDKIYR